MASHASTYGFASSGYRDSYAYDASTSTATCQFFMRIVKEQGIYYVYCTLRGTPTGCAPTQVSVYLNDSSIETISVSSADDVYSVLARYQ